MKNLIISTFWAILVFSPSYSSAQGIRLLVLKHDNSAMANMDANLAVEAVTKSGGIHIGTYSIVGGKRKYKDLYDRLYWQFVEKAEKGDTLIVHTIGHGVPNQLIGLGSRKEIFKMIQDLAEHAKQRTVWWQLSCHACSGLPTPTVKNLVIVSSSPANQLSGTHNQARIMGEVLSSLTNLDQDESGDICASELSTFMNSLDSLNRGDLVYSSSKDCMVFTLQNKKKEK